MTTSPSKDLSDLQALVIQRIPRRSLGDLLAEAILRGKAAETRRAYRGDLQHFFDTMPGLRELEETLPEAIDG